jgi:hypothetical protein
MEVSIESDQGAAFSCLVQGEVLVVVDAKRLTDTPGMIEDSDIEALRAAGWDERGIWQATALVSFFNSSGRLEATAGLPPDKVPATARLKEATPDGRSALTLTRI